MRGVPTSERGCGVSELTKCNHDYCYHEYIGLAGVRCLKCENKQLKEHLAAAHEALADWKRIADAETDRRAEWGRVARSRPMVIDNQEAGLEIERLRVRLAAAEAALQRPMDVQNGPPLIRDTQEWNEAMAEACGVLRNANAMQFYLTGVEAAKGEQDECPRQD